MYVLYSSHNQRHVQTIIPVCGWSVGRLLSESFFSDISIRGTRIIMENTALWQASSYVRNNVFFNPPHLSTPRL